MCSLLSRVILFIIKLFFYLAVILLLQCVSTQIAQGFGWRSQKLGFQDGHYGRHFGYPISMIFSYFFIYTSTCCYIVSFNLTRLAVCEMSKTDFQYGGCGGYLGFPINTILAHFNPEVFLLLQNKFRLKSTKGLGRDVEN